MKGFYTNPGTTQKKRFKLPPELGRRSMLLMALLLGTQLLFSEGTKQLAPSPQDMAMLLIGNQDFGNFAAYNAPENSRLYFTIKDASEIVYLGLSQKFSSSGNPLSSGVYQFRIRRASDGAIVHGPFSLNAFTANLHTWQEAASGPEPITGSGGYDVTHAAYTFDPNQAGDYFIEFDGVPYLGYFDISVAKNGALEEGRVWSRNWALRTPADVNILPECVWDREFNAKLYSYTTDGFVSEIDFQNSGFQGLSFNLAFNSTGPGTTGNVALDRMSIPNDNFTANSDGHQIFLNQPDPTIFLDGTCGSIDVSDSFYCTQLEGYCLPVTVNTLGLIEVVFDFNHNGVFDPDSEDVLLVHQVNDLNDLSPCIAWDGLKGDGSPVGFNDVVDLKVTFAQGVQHWAVFDGEFMKNGFCVNVVRPICNPVASTDVLYWDDRNIPDNPGTGQPKDGREGCICDTDGCRTWNYFDPNTENCSNVQDNNTLGYGDKNTLNTWWFARIATFTQADIPIFATQIEGVTEICSNTDIELTLNFSGSSAIESIQWFGPGGTLISSGGAENTSITVNTPGTYRAVAIDEFGCQTEDTHIINLITCPIDLELDKSVDNATPYIGDQVTFMLVIRNNGPGGATGVQVEDDLPSGFTNIQNISNGGVLTGGKVRWTGISLTPGQVIMVSFTATVGVGNYVNLAEITTANEDDTDSTPNNGVDTDGDGNVEDDPDDEDDGDGVVVTPFPCDINATVSNVTCHHNGTPTEGFDDTFTFDVMVNGVSTGSGWTANSGETGNYNQTITFGPFNISEGDVSVVITDALSGTCQATLQVEAPESCSDQCEINLEITNVRCNNGGTEADPSDDTFTFQAFASGYNLGNGWTATDDNNTTGNYDQLITFGPYQISDGDISFELVDNAEPTCTAVVNVPAPPSCSDICLMTASIFNKVCDNNGTPNNPGDDLYYFDAIVTGFNVSGSWTATNGTTGAYNETVTFGPFNISQGAVSFILTDDEDETCHTVILVNAPLTCSPICAIAPIVSNVVCDNNGTESDASDDQFTFDVVIGGFNYGDGWTSNDPNGTSGDYYETVTFGPYPISEGDVSFIIRDNDDTGCTTTVNVAAPSTCSGVCLITADISNKICDDNGTPSDASDDVYYFDAVITGFNTGGGWTSSDGTSGAYNVPVTFGPYPIADGAVSFIVTDNAEETCTTVILVNAPETCSPVCAIAPIISNIVCDNNGTGGDASDDTFTFDVEVGGFNISGSGWTATDLDGTTGAYYQTVTFGPYPISAGSISFDIRDNDDANCTTPIVVNAPPSCSDNCEIDFNLTNIRCDDNGTPSQDFDDVFYFDVELTGFNLGNGWIATDGTVGVYNNVTTFGPYAISEGDVTLTITDNDDGECTAVIFAAAPPTCSDQCELIVEILEARCEDSGTPSHADDDVFYVDVFVNGYNLGSHWSLEDGTTGDYNVITTLGPYPIADGDRIMAFTDNADGECIFEILAEAPATCSDQCLIEAQVLEVSCDDLGTLESPWDDVYTFELRVAGLNTSGTWIASDGSTGNYNEITLSVPHLISEGPVSILIMDSGATDCAVEVNASPPDVGINCPETTDEGRTVRNVQLIEGDLDESDGTFSVEDSLCWLPFVSESGERAYDMTSLRTTNNVEGPALFTFILYTDMDVPVSPSGMPENMIDGYGAIFFGNYDSGEPCCNLQTRGGQPYSEGQTIQVGPIIDTTGMFNGLLTPVLQMSIQMAPGQLYTLATTTWLPEQYGHYVWAVISHDGEQLLSPQLGLEPFPDTEVEVSQTLTFYDIESIVHNPASLDITGAPIPTTYCGLDSISFRDYLTEFRECQDITLTRVFTVSDILGNQDSCIQEILFRKPEINDIVFPPASVLFACNEEYLANENGLPDPSLTGFPFILTLDGYEILHEGANYNIQIAYNDTEVYIGEHLSEVLREWTIVDECNFDTIGRFTQMMKFSQICDPIIECPLSNHYCPILEQNIMLFQTDPDECTATVTIALPDISGISAALVNVETQIYSLPDTIPVDTFFTGEERILFDLEIGDYLIRYIVTDNDGNIYTQDCIFRVADLEAPIAICADGLNISLTGSGLQRLYVDNINMESYDNCEIDNILLRRIYYRDPLTCDTLLEPYYSEYGPYVEFNCCDVGLVITVEMQVADVSGNVNSCWVDVLVEDYTLPICYGLSNTSLNCETLPEDFDPTDILQLQILFGVPEVYDNCAADFIEFEPTLNLDNCSSGTIERKFLAVDQFGNESLDTFRQLLSISENLEYEIRFPMDAASDGMHSPDTLKLTMTSCDDFTVTYEDEFLMLEMDECYNILRTFSVINNCEYDGVSAPVIISRDEDCNGAEGEDHVWVLHRGDHIYIDKDSMNVNMIPAAGTKGLSCDGMTNPDGYWRETTSTGYWMYTQRILMYDTIPAEVQYEDQAPFCTDSECVGQVDFPFTIFENAVAAGLEIRVFLDAGADGTADLDLTETGALTGSYPNYLISGTFPIGNHQFLIDVLDGCGNVGNGALPFDVIDCYVPDPICQSGLVVNLLALAPDTDADGDGDIDDGAVAVLASDLAACNVGDCSEPLRFSVNRIGQIPSPDQERIILTCDDRFSITLEVYVWDNAFNPYAMQPDGTLGGPNYKSCEALVLVQDFDAVCMDCASGLRMDGRITNVNGIGLAEVMVGIDDESFENATTDILGNFHFSNMEYHGDYTLKPVYNEGLTTGLSTQDIIRIYWHIQEIQPITSPFLLLAADVNHSGSITNEDMEQILMALTGEITAFDNNPSWIFVDANYVFTNPANPWAEAYPDYIYIEDMTQCMDELDFIGVKVGDVSQTGTSGPGNPNDPTSEPDDPDHEIDLRTMKNTTLRTIDRQLVAGETYEVKMQAPDLAQLTGCQYTLRFDPKALSLENIREGDLGATNIGTRYLEEGVILVSWYRAGGELTTDENLFTFVFRATRNGKLSDLISMDSDYLKAEAYDQTAETLGLQLAFGEDASTTVVRLHQNHPNPFRNETVIGFELPTDNNATVTITDLRGKVVKRIEGNYSRGYHEIVIKNSELTGSGVYYYILETNTGTATRKMILIEKS